MAEEMSELFANVKTLLDHLLQMRETNHVTMQNALDKLCNGAELGHKPTLEDIEDPVIQELMCLINLDQIHLNTTTECLVSVTEILKRMSCMVKEGD